MIDAIIKGRIIPLYNDEILEEYEDVLHRDKFPFKDSDARKENHRGSNERHHPINDREKKL